MPPKKKSTAAKRKPSKPAAKRKPSKPAAKRKPSKPAAKPAGAADLPEALAWLKSHSKQSTRDGMARYGIPSDNALGVTVADIRVLAKRLGHSHELAGALWKSGGYEARMLAAFVDEPERISAAEMDRYCRDFDNWAITDTLCFHLFDRTPHAWQKVEQWHDRREEFIKRAAFALLASLALHRNRDADDAPFLNSLRFIERAASDERNFVKKGVSWALRGIGRRNPKLKAAALTLARKLAASEQPAERWVGKDTLRDLK